MIQRQHLHSNHYPKDLYWQVVCARTIILGPWPANVLHIVVLFRSNASLAEVYATEHLERCTVCILRIEQNSTLELSHHAIDLHHCEVAPMHSEQAQLSTADEVSRVL